MSGLHHERNRLIRLVDDFIKGNSDDREDDTRIDQAMIVATAHYDREGIERETVLMCAETKRRYVQLGLIELVANEIKNDFQAVGDDA